MHKPINAKFGTIINAVADGGGVGVSAKDRALQQQNQRTVKPEPPKPKGQK